MIHGLNLHNVVRGVITSIHPDENCTLYQSIGQQNIKGKVIPIYAEPQEIKANFQSDGEALRQTDGMNQTPYSESAYLYSEDYGVSGQQRLLVTRTGDFIKRMDGTWYLITSVLEDWTWDGWAKVKVDRQIDPPNFSASEWSDDYVRSCK